MGMIPNPTKNFTINKPIDDVKKIINRIPEFCFKCKLKSSDDIIGEYEFDFSQAMVGNIITMSLNEISDSKTEIKLEASRVMGAYDKAMEVTTANIDLKDLTQSISKLIENPDVEAPKENSGCGGASVVILLIIISSVTMFI